MSAPLKTSQLIHIFDYSGIGDNPVITDAQLKMLSQALLIAAEVVRDLGSPLLASGIVRKHEQVEQVIRERAKKSLAFL